MKICWETNRCYKEPIEPCLTHVGQSSERPRPLHPHTITQCSGTHSCKPPERSTPGANTSGQHTTLYERDLPHTPSKLCPHCWGMNSPQRTRPALIRQMRKAVKMWQKKTKNTQQLIQYCVGQMKAQREKGTGPAPVWTLQAVAPWKKKSSTQKQASSSSLFSLHCFTCDGI